jgi:acetylornithine deacetylase/succinyl-diaminopimelate desuccinylase-like protein
MRQLAIAVCVLASMFWDAGSAIRAQSLTDQIRAYRQAHESEIVGELIDLLSVPNVASDSVNIQRNAAMLIGMMSRRGYRAVRTPMSLPVVKKIISTVGQAIGQKPVLIPTLGGSGPLWIFEEATGAPQVGVPIVNHDNNQHGANENLRLQNLWDGIEVLAAIMAMR